ncbi:MAG: chemotaxis protein CheX [bacterium]
MIGQFFGNYLLNIGSISREDLLKAMELKRDSQVKLGLLAIDAGYLTPEQVNMLNQKQQTADKKPEELAVEMNLLTEEQVNELLQRQADSYLSFAQTLVEQGFLTDAQLNQALADYKQKYALPEQDLDNEQGESIKAILEDFYSFGDSAEEEIYIKYIELIFKNIVKFIGDDFIPLSPAESSEYDMNWNVQQQIVGKVNLLTGIEASKNSFMKFAERYADETDMKKEYAQEVVGDFLNLHNGLFIVNLSSEDSLELYLRPQESIAQGTVRFKKEIICLPLCFSFGIVNVLLINQD